MSNLLLLLSIGHFGMFAWFLWLWLINSQIQRHQRSIEASRHEAIERRLADLLEAEQWFQMYSGLVRDGQIKGGSDREAND